MEHIIIDDAFTVGNPRMDYQHAEMVRLLNAMLGSDGTVVDSEEFSLHLTRATEYAVVHFRQEEQLMEKAGYPGLDVHRQSHKKYRKRIAEFCLQALDKRSNVPEELLCFLMAWWRNHILVEDAGYRPYVETMQDE